MGVCKKCNGIILEIFQVKILRIMVNVSWYIRNKNNHQNLNVPVLAGEIKRMSKVMRKVPPSSKYSTSVVNEYV